MQNAWNYHFGKLPRKEKESYNGLEKNTKSSTEFKVNFLASQPNIYERKEQIQKERWII